MTHDQERKIIADWIFNDLDQFDLDDFGFAAAEDLLSKLRPLVHQGALARPAGTGERNPATFNAEERQEGSCLK